MTSPIAVPSMGGIKSTAEDALVGAAAGAIFALAQKFFGRGWIGSIVGIVLAGTMIKGDRGQDVVTMLGALAAIDLLGGSVVPGSGGSTSGGSGFLAI